MGILQFILHFVLHLYTY